MNRTRTLIATTTLAIGALTIGACTPPITIIPTGDTPDMPARPAVVERRTEPGSPDDLFTCWGTALLDRASLNGTGIDPDKDCVPGDTRKDGAYVTCDSGDGRVTTDAALATDLDLTGCTPVTEATK